MQGAKTTAAMNFVGSVPPRTWLLLSAATGAWLAFRSPSYKYAGSQSDYDDMLDELGIDPAVAKAVMKIEAGGKSRVAGRIVIRFESHVFKRESRGGIVLLPGMATHRDGRRRFSDRKRSFTERQAEEYRALARAADISEEAAYRSISMGIAQIMGFNRKRLGFKSAKEMFLTFQDSPDVAQKIAFLKYVASDRRLLKAARSRDFRTFARIYNGDKTGRYASRMEKAYDAVA